jgi:hypothetical protein
MSIFKNISPEEKDLLLTFPAYISILASNNDGYLGDAEMHSGMELAYIRTFSNNLLLDEFYTEAYAVFEKNLLELNRNLPIGEGDRELSIKKELANIDKIVLKISKSYASALHRSMESFKEHIEKAQRSALVDFFFRFQD